MDKMTLHNGRTSYFIFGIVLFAILTVLLRAIGGFNFCYIEQWSTFIYNVNYVNGLLAQPGGCAQLISAFLIQFFAIPLVGIAITAFLLTAITLLTFSILHKWTDRLYSSFLAFFPTIALLILHFNTNYMYAGSVAIILMLICLRIQIAIKRFTIRIVFTYISGILLFVAAGPIALLYSELILIIELFNNKFKALYFTVLPLIIVAAAQTSIWLGYFGQLKHALLPNGYFTIRLQAGSIVFMPWSLMLSVFVICGICKFINIKKRYLQIAVIASVIVGETIFIIFGTSKYINFDNEAFKELNFYASNCQWENIIDKCEHLPKNNLLFQNYNNMAMAEMGTLADQLFKNPCYDIRSIYMTENRTPYISAILSDIYFSMGHMAFAQRYAFEANEQMNNFSPRMLKRLVQTNIAYGQYATAQKYLKILRETLFYRDWALANERLLWNESAIEADSVLGIKRNCIFSDNRFSGSRGLDDDLKQIVLNNPLHKTTIQYLGSLYLLSKDIQKFKNTIETFYNTTALQPVLPTCFQEGVLIFAADNQEILEKYKIEPSTIQRFAIFNQKTTTDNFWYFYKYSN